MKLITIMNAFIDDFVLESPNRIPTIQITQVLIFITIRLLGNLYSLAANK